LSDPQVSAVSLHGYSAKQVIPQLLIVRMAAQPGPRSSRSGNAPFDSGRRSPSSLAASF